MKLVISVSFRLVVALALGYCAQSYLSHLISPNASILSTLFNTLGGIYALVTAFVLVEVWSQYNNLDSALSSEAKVLTSLWNYTDYLNDKNVSKAMKTSLTSYITTVLNVEVPAMANNQTLVHPSKELTGIMQVIDQIKFNDPRDASAFKSIIQSFENLSTQRMGRISQGSTRIPITLRAFFEMVSYAFLGSFLLQSFTHQGLYLISVGSLSLIVFYVREIILDLDNPFDGLWNVSTHSYHQALDYINQSRHEK